MKVTNLTEGGVLINDLSRVEPIWLSGKDDYKIIKNIDLAPDYEFLLDLFEGKVKFELEVESDTKEKTEKKVETPKEKKVEEKAEKVEAPKEDVKEVEQPKTEEKAKEEKPTKSKSK